MALVDDYTALSALTFWGQRLVTIVIGFSPIVANATEVAVVMRKISMVGGTGTSGFAWVTEHGSLSPTVDIVMSTFNGERYLAQQLDSILSQTFTDWRLIVRDDGSTDGTGAILESYRQCYPDKIQLLAATSHLGVRESFSVLLQESTAPYTMFCDQDDVWSPFKIEKSVRVMQETEQTYSPMPLLIYTDLTIVDADLTIQDRSFLHYQKSRPLTDFKSLLVTNTIAGCTICMNERLRTLIGTIPDSAMMHDWWAGLVAAAFGRVIFVPESTVLYRQHSRNVVGAARRALSGVWFYHASGRWRQDLMVTHDHARAFLRQYETCLPVPLARLIKDWACLPTRPFWVRKFLVLKHGIKRGSVLASWVLLLLI